MKKFLMILFSVFLVMSFSGIVSATPIDFDLAGSPDSFVSVTVNGTLGWTDLTGSIDSELGNQIFTLSEGQTKEIDFFTLTASGIGLGDATVAATLAFDVPAVASANGSGPAYWGTFFGLVSGGVLTWDTNTLPDYYTLDDGNKFSVDFESGVALTLGSTATVHAYITHEGTDTVAPVPEPATLFLLGTGLVGIAGASRKKIFKKK